MTKWSVPWQYVEEHSGEWCGPAYRSRRRFAVKGQQRCIKGLWVYRVFRNNKEPRSVDLIILAK